MCTSMILIHVWNMQNGSVHRTGINRLPGTKFGSRLIASLKKWMAKKENEIPKYLTGKKNGIRSKSVIDKNED